MQILRRTILVSMLFLLYTTTGIASQENTTNAIEQTDELANYLVSAEGKKISALVITPGKRTKTEYIISLIDLDKDEIYTQDLHKNIYLKLWKTGLFYEIIIIPSLNYTNTEPTVKLKVLITDKWTLIPIPLFSLDSKNFYAGLAIAELNLFGYGNTLVFSGLYGTDKFFFSTIFRYTKIKRSNFSLSLASNIGINQYEEYTYGQSNIYNTSNTNVNTLVRKSQGSVVNARGRLQYDLTQELAVYSSTEIHMFQDNTAVANSAEQTGNNASLYDDNYQTSLNPIPSSWHLPWSFGLSYTALLPSGILSKGFSIDVRYTPFMLSSDMRYYNSIAIDTVYNLEMGKSKRQILSFRMDGAYGNLPLILSEVLGAGKNTNSISANSIRTNKHLSASIEHVITVWKNKKGGIFTSYGSDASLYEITGYQEIESPVLNGGVYITSGFTLNQIAIPLIKVSLGYNVAAEYMTYSISAGTR